MTAWACNATDLAEENLDPPFRGPGLYLDQSWNVLRVEKDRREASSHIQATAFVVFYLASYKSEVMGPFDGGYAHPFCEDTNYTRGTMADQRGQLRRKA